MRAAPALTKLVQAPKPDPHLRLEAVSALGAVGGDGTYDALLDLLADPSPAIRARRAPIAGPARSEGIRHDAVRAGCRSGTGPCGWRSPRLSGTLSPEIGLPRLRTMLRRPRSARRAVGARLAREVASADAASVLTGSAKADDAVVRAAAATALGELKPPGAAAALARGLSVR